MTLTPQPPTEKQANFLASLCQERGIDYAGLQAQAIALGTWTRRDISLAIDDIKTWPKTPQAPVPVGVHVQPGTEADTIPVLVQVKESRSSGNPYGKIRPADGRSWVYRPGAIKGLSEATLLDEATAAKLGLQFGLCQVCGRDLTDPESVRLGIGPVCRKRVAQRWAQAGTVPTPNAGQILDAQRVDKLAKLPSSDTRPVIDPVQAILEIERLLGGNDAVTRASSARGVQEAPGSTQTPSVPSDTGSSPYAAPGGSQGGLTGAVTQESGRCPWGPTHTLKLQGQAHGFDGPTCGTCGGAVILDRATMAYHPDRNRSLHHRAEEPPPPVPAREPVTLESLEEEAHRRAIDKTTGKRKIRQAKLKGDRR